MKTLTVYCGHLIQGILIVMTVGVCMSYSQEAPTYLAKTSTTDPTLAWHRYPVEGFAWPTSVLPGEVIKFYVCTMPRGDTLTYDIDIFRVPNVPNEDSMVWSRHGIIGQVGRFLRPRPYQSTLRILHSAIVCRNGGI